GKAAELREVFEGRPHVIQPFIASIVDEGEYSMFYFSNEFSHAIRKTPKQGDFRVQEEYGAEIVAFVGNAEAKQALKDGRCVAWVYDDSSIMADLASGDWNDYEMPLATEDDNPWGLAVPLAERESLFGRFMSGMIYDWHASGRLIELEKKWGIQPTAYLQKMHEKFKPNRAHLN
ncbi:MAG: transporter substrate-binding domain-containing protein, partial [Gammaproteobacteria bacterium]|nr:transporter substrate-binding domain-containing protein [Gammaproteobacteria bacterium]